MRGYVPLPTSFNLVGLPHNVVGGVGERTRLISSRLFAGSFIHPTLMENQ